GIGKSTLLLQICNAIGGSGSRILYVSGEESATQIKLRADRLGIVTGNLLVASQTNVDIIRHMIAQTKPDLLIIDSIQTMYREDISSAPGSVSQVRECTAAFMRVAKEDGISVVVVGHVTKDGAIAGPRVLEHMVDVVLYFEGERRELYRLLRSVKNRYGSTNEIGVFEMGDSGLREIVNPSEYMLAGRPIGVTGSVVTCSIEGTRPLLAEVQALVTYTNFGTPRRMASGMDYNRVVMLIAVLEKRAGMQLGSYDSYVNIAGGLKILEPALDVSALLAIASSYRNKPVDPFTMVFGEVGLTGEMRAVTLAEKRLNEAVKLGFKACVMPKENTKGLKVPSGIRVFGAGNIAELLQIALD
ncbi:MAG: DNA repair protein RadA, partial [Defluviitaleaceae bacterium]|nr:DNA repair protein RadA [Defluviitaleaceae bacterium]